MDLKRIDEFNENGEKVSVRRVVNIERVPLSKVREMIRTPTAQVGDAFRNLDKDTVIEDFRDGWTMINTGQGEAAFTSSSQAKDDPHKSGRTLGIVAAILAVIGVVGVVLYPRLRATRVSAR